MLSQLTATIEQEEGGVFVALCLDSGVVSQGDTAEESLENLREAVSLFLETASPEEIERWRERRPL
jgi:predicted RNase H-like HicB family nuclease